MSHPKFDAFRNERLQNPSIRAAYEEAKVRRDDLATTARLEAAEQLREAADDIRAARLGTDLDDIADELGKRAEQVEAGER